MEKLKSNDSNAFSCSLRILGRRDHSEKELRDKLRRYGFAPTAIDDAITRCTEYNYLNDQRYALARAREMMTSGRGVGPRVLLELRKRGIREGLARDVMTTLAEEFPADSILSQQLERRFPGFHFSSASDKERRRVINYFQRRGFRLDMILRHVKEGS